MKLLAGWQHQGPLLALWPYRNDVWRANAFFVQQRLLQMLAAITPFHPVKLGIHPPQINTALRMIPKALEWFPIAYDDAWARDIAPLIVHDSKAYSAVGARFDGWQGVHQSYARDQRFAASLAARMNSPFSALPVVFEGGMLSHDGNGTALVHAHSLKKRNPTMRLMQLQRLLQERLQLQRIIWIHSPLAADETGGHVDNQIQFIGQDTIVAAASVHDNAWNQELEALQQQPWAAEYRWLMLPPTTTYKEDPALYHDIRQHAGALTRGQRPVLRSYVNLISLPNVLVLPQFSQASDLDALRVLQQGVPTRTVVPVDGREFVRGGGGPHCLTTEIIDRRLALI
ncbi:Putative agmatine deiminase [Pseudidiomarina piscicola]|uniref:Agmatine deiminase n=1 Tax=Pseudidiomarina piscicola TaxID=2614830 RepID=A0A6S6WN18_9GAMM|nr:agmatine deiminase family protein [Pseudidiomarina piscicola]CAB0150393.1 Putative agmatine deiminase [Pseudidiomarina piscicola]VZT39822.1 Putative agmatine deiminase [Pseudomonas aeruginosa]